MIEELKPCPFCGGKAEFRTLRNCSTHSDVGVNFTIRCSKCGIEQQTIYEVNFGLSRKGEIALGTDQREKAVKEWNRRANDGKID